METSFTYEGFADMGTQDYVPKASQYATLLLLHGLTLFDTVEPEDAEKFESYLKSANKVGKYDGRAIIARKTLGVPGNGDVSLNLWKVGRVGRGREAQNVFIAQDASASGSPFGADAKRELTPEEAEAEAKRNEIKARSAQKAVKETAKTSVDVAQSIRDFFTVLVKGKKAVENDKKESFDGARIDDTRSWSHVGGLPRSVRRHYTREFVYEMQRSAKPGHTIVKVAKRSPAGDPGVFFPIDNAGAALRSWTGETPRHYSPKLAAELAAMHYAAHRNAGDVFGAANPFSARAFGVISNRGKKRYNKFLQPGVELIVTQRSVVSGGDGMFRPEIQAHGRVESLGVFKDWRGVSDAFTRAVPKYKDGFGAKPPAGGLPPREPSPKKWVFVLTKRRVTAPNGKKATVTKLLRAPLTLRTGNKKKDKRIANRDFVLFVLTHPHPYLGHAFVRIGKKYAVVNVWGALDKLGRPIRIAQVIKWLSAGAGNVNIEEFDESAYPTDEAAELEASSGDGEDAGVTDDELFTAEQEMEEFGNAQSSAPSVDSNLRVYRVEGEQASLRGGPGDARHGMLVEAIGQRGVYVGERRLYHPERKCFEAFRVWRLVRNAGTKNQKIVFYAQASV